MRKRNPNKRRNTLSPQTYPFEIEDSEFSFDFEMHIFKRHIGFRIEFEFDRHIRFRIETEVAFNVNSIVGDV